MRTTPCVQISRRQLRNAVQDLGDRLAGHGDVLQHMQGEGRWPEDEGIGHQFALPIASRNHGAFAFVLLIWAATKEVPRGTFHSPKHQIIANPLGRKISCQTRETKKTVHRDSKSGEFTTEKKAKANPATTEKERVRTGQKKK